MKRLILILLTSMLIFSSCTNESVPVEKINVNDINSLTISILPNPIREKRILEIKYTKKEDIKKIIDIVNSIKKDKTNHQDIKGFTLSIQTFGNKEHVINFFGDNIVIDKSAYKMDGTDIDKVKNLYNKLNYGEKSSYASPYEYKSK